MMTPVASTSATSTSCMRGLGRLSVTLSTTPTSVTSLPTSARPMGVTREKSR